ncbi:MAG TPA: hypothetical protein VEL70_08740 [Candidatus Acidoferrum sp.]|nr:hypothetical protein [Candidatus Acidoferrum sp.]
MLPGITHGSLQIHFTFTSHWCEPNKGHITDQNKQISASGSKVYVTWWTNKTGVLMPVFRDK